MSITSLETILRKAARKAATGKELKYFWNGKDEEIVEDRQDILRTTLAVYEKENTDDKVEATNGSYEVDRYKMPNVKWFTDLANYSHKIYLTDVDRVNQKYLDVKTRPMFDEKDSEAKKGEILSPSEFAAALEQISQYNKAYEQTCEVTKNPLAFTDLHGMFVDDENYRVFNRGGDRTTAQYLRFESDFFKKFGSPDDILTDKALIKEVSGKTDEE